MSTAARSPDCLPWSELLIFMAFPWTIWRGVLICRRGGSALRGGVLCPRRQSTQSATGGKAPRNALGCAFVCSGAFPPDPLVTGDATLVAFNGDRGRAPGDFLGTFVSLQKYLAPGRTLPRPTPARRRRKTGLPHQCAHWSATTKTDSLRPAGAANPPTQKESR